MYVVGPSTSPVLRATRIALSLPFGVPSSSCVLAPLSHGVHPSNPAVHAAMLDVDLSKHAVRLSKRDAHLSKLAVRSSDSPLPPFEPRVRRSCLASHRHSSPFFSPSLR